MKLRYKDKLKIYELYFKQGRCLNNYYFIVNMTGSSPDNGTGNIQISIPFLI